MNIGLPRQDTVMAWPSLIAAMSTSIGTPAATVLASGANCDSIGHKATPPPTSAQPDAMMVRKSRRDGSCASPVAVPAVVAAEV